MFWNGSEPGTQGKLKAVSIQDPVEDRPAGHTGPAAADGLCQGIGYTAALVIMCVIREFLGSGTFGAGVISADGVRILPEAYPALMMILPVGGFLTLACLIAFSQWLTKKLEAREAKKEVQA